MIKIKITDSDANTLLAAMVAPACDDYVKIPVCSKWGEDVCDGLGIDNKALMSRLKQERVLRAGLRLWEL